MSTPVPTTGDLLATHPAGGKNSRPRLLGCAVPHESPSASVIYWGSHDVTNTGGLRVMKSSCSRSGELDVATAVDLPPSRWTYPASFLHAADRIAPYVYR